MTVPRHVAIIMDGNGRWAKRRMLPRIAGHRAGVEAVRTVARAARDLKIEALTLYAFSSENWRRPEEEIGDLMGLLRRFIGEHLDELAADGVQLRIIGDLSRFTPDVRTMVEGAVARCAVNTGPILAIALNYGSQDEILRAANIVAEQGGTIDRARFEAALYTTDLPPLDLIIRTSGEQRLSNFLLWQAAYAELIFVDTLWPDFDGAALADALAVFAQRQRRFGGLMNDLAKRSLSGVILIAVAAAALWFGHLAFWLLTAVAGLLMMAEWVELHGTDAKTKRNCQFAVSVPLAIMCPLASGASFLSLGLIAGAAFFIAAITRRSALGWGAVYVGLPVLALLLLRSIEGPGLLFAFWAMSVVWATDIGAYFAGRTIGGPKIAPAISPSKTWAGLVGGVIAATLFAFALHVWCGLPFRLVIWTPLLACIAQAGDFFESWLKRRAGVKDSGSLLPGHGGVLDRLDGLVPVAPLAALLVELPKWL